jgi:hypothetical protein
MRRDRFLLAVASVFWAIAVAVYGQAPEPANNGSPLPAYSPAHDGIRLFFSANTYGAFSRDALVKFSPPENFIEAAGASADRPGKPKPDTEPVKRPPIDPSMVGYIDDAIIHTEVRVRFDAATHNDTPDRAEFFYAKCGCYRSLPTSNPAYDPNAPGPGPGVPQYVNFQQLYLYGEYALLPHSHKFSLLGQLPFRWLQPHAPSGTAQAFPDNGGIGDIQVGAKFAPISSPTRFLTFQLISSIPSGDPRKGLGTNHATIEPKVLYYQALSDRMAVEAQFGDTHPLSSSSGVPTVGGHSFAGDVITYGVGTSYRILDKEQFWMAGVLEMVGWNVQGGMATGRTSTDGVNIVNMKIGPRFSFGTHQSLYVGYGIALTNQTWYREILRTEYRYAF